MFIKACDTIIGFERMRCDVNCKAELGGRGVVRNLR
jgi:hypothetical protein